LQLVKRPQQAEIRNARLPLPAGPLLGRRSELAELRTLLADENTRLVTLTGAGGTGKSRLALEVAAQSANEFSHVWFIDLTTVRDAEQVPSALAQAVGAQERGGPLESIFQDMFSEGRSLVILDNFEHVMAAAAFVARLLARCRGLVVLVTSRESLALRSERVYFVEPLPTPDLDRLGDAAAIRRVPSVMLFEERARARRASFRLTDADLPAVAEICVRLDGLPLAIELAAAQAAVLSPAAILRRLDTRAPFITSGARDLPARHQTLEATVAWSYDLLEAEERRVFRACGAFVGGFTAEAVASVCDKVASETEVLLAQLVAKSLIRVAELASETPRFWLLETIRGYASDQLALCGELAGVRARHAQFYLELAQDLQSSLRGPRMAVALDRLASEYGNFRAVFEWATTDGDLGTGLQLAGALYRFWIARGHVTEARTWLELALSRHAAVEPRVRAVALNAAGVLAGMQHEHDKAIAFLTESLELWQSLGDTHHQAGAYVNIGSVAWATGRVDEARQLFERAQRLYILVGDLGGQANAVGSRALIAREQGDSGGAARLFGEALDLSQAIGDDWGAANSLANLGQVMLAAHDRAGAAAAFREALQKRRALGDILHIPECFEGLAALAADRQPRRAARLLGAAEALRERLGAPVAAADQARLVDLVGRVRRSVRPDTFDSAWQEGRDLAIDTAIDLALRDEPASPSADHGSDGEVERLSVREREIAQLITQGRSNREIAETLVLSIKTVESHVKNVCKKLHVGSRAEIAAWAARQGLI
jgi:predicted ATPase/DNA-binding CsgD family transcriptional regulator